MPQRTSQEAGLSSEGNSLLLALRNAPEALTLTEVQQQAGLQALSPSTIRRRLQELIALDLVRSQGATKNRRYLAVHSSPVTTRPVQMAPAPATEPSPPSVSEVPLSRDGAAIRRSVDRPVTARRPATYERAFLDDYHPNETFYLPASTRERLMKLGRTTDTPQPGGTYARQILQRLLIDLSWNSSRLEGNTYSLLDTRRLLLEGLPATDKGILEEQMILNHKAAIEWIVEEVGASSRPPIHSRFLRNLHALMMENLISDPASIGRVRTHPVQIGGSTYIPLAVPQQLEECLTQVALTADRVEDPYEQSFFLLVHIPYLEAFIDGNKRTARLAANIPLIRDNLRPMTFVDVPERALVEAFLGVYELRRIELLRDVFVWGYERACAHYTVVQQSVGEPDPFHLAHRALIKEAVAALVRAGRGASDYSPAAEPFAARLPPQERLRFLAVIETELAGLHEGNFSRFGLRPSEFEAWAGNARRV